MEKQKEFEKQVYENQETAIKLLQENVKLKNTMKELKEEIEYCIKYKKGLNLKGMLKIIEKGEIK